MPVLARASIDCIASILLKALVHQNVRTQRVIPHAKVHPLRQMQNHGCESYALYTDPPKAIDHDFIVRQFEACALKVDFMLNELVQGLHCQLINFFSLVVL